MAERTRRVRQLRVNACVDCSDWITAGLSGPLPKVCEFCAARRHRKWMREYQRGRQFPSNEPEARREWYTRNHARVRELAKLRYARRGTDLQRQLGVSQREYGELLESQGGVCAICAQPPGRVRLHLDHDHDTGRVRGLLCAACNRGIGSLGDDRDRVLRAAEYLS